MALLSRNAQGSGPTHIETGKGRLPALQPSTSHCCSATATYVALTCNTSVMLAFRPFSPIRPVLPDPAHSIHHPCLRFAGPSCTACGTDQICPGGSRDPPLRCPGGGASTPTANAVSLADCQCIAGYGRVGKGHSAGVSRIGLAPCDTKVGGSNPFFLKIMGLILAQVQQAQHMSLGVGFDCHPGRPPGQQHQGSSALNACMQNYGLKSCSDASERHMTDVSAKKHVL